MRACPRLRSKGACACGLPQVLNIRLWPSPQFKKGATMQLSRTSFNRTTRQSATIAGSWWVTLLMLGAQSAAAQGISGMNDALQRKYNILEPQAETERMRAETERMRAEAEVSQSRGRSYPSARNASAGSQQYVVPTGIDSLEGTDASTYRLGNGTILRVSGIFWPDAPTVCIAFCP